MTKHSPPPQRNLVASLVRACEMLLVIW